MICCAFIAAVSTVFGNLAIAYGVEVGVNESITLWLVVAANVVALFTQPMFGMLADRIGRKPVFIYGALSSAAFMPFYLLSMSQDNELLTFALAVLTFSFGYAAANATWPSFYGEMFNARVRFSGVAIGTQLGFLMAGFAPTHRHRARRRAGGRLGRHRRLHRGHRPHRGDLRLDRQGDPRRAHGPARPEAVRQGSRDEGSR